MSQASEKQINFIIKLMSEKDQDQCTQASFINAINATINTHPTQLTKANASKAIDILLKTPAKIKADSSTTVTAAKMPAVSPGFYIYNDKVYKVVTSPNSGHNYVKVNNNGSWEYAAGFLKNLYGVPAMTLEDAKAFGKLYGSCVVCGRTLTDEASIDAGIGPVCAGKL